MKRALLVLGMHRSGTSALTYVVSRLGADLPRALLPAISGNNELGFWEPMHLVAIHDELLRSAGTSWNDFQAFPNKWYETQSAKEYRDRIVQLLNEEFGESDFFVIKDPRICRLVPLWLEVLKLFGAEPNFILPLRNPLEVAFSLKKRDRLSIGRGTLIWLRHVLEAERFSRPFNRSFVTYSGLLDDWQGTAEKMACDLELDWPAPYNSVATQIDSFLVSSFRHHRFEEFDLDQESNVSDWVIKTYNTLMLAGSKESLGFQRTLDEVFACFEKACLAFKGLFDDVEGRIERECEVLRDQLKLEKKNARAEIEYREALVSDLHQQLENEKLHLHRLIKEEKTNARAQIEYRDALNAELHQQLDAEKVNAQSQIEYRDSLVAELEAQWDGLNNSPQRLVMRLGQLLSHKMLKRG